MNAADIDYNGRRFVGIVNYDEGDFTTETIFQYWQLPNRDVVWGIYQGGAVSFGTFVAKILSDGSLDMPWHHLNTLGELKTGKCISIPETLSDGRLRLHESWQTTDDKLSAGTSIIEELKGVVEGNTKNETF